MVAAEYVRPTLADIMGDEQHVVLVGDVLERLRDLPDASVQCVVTSPPYLSLRAYGTAPQVWGGDPEHDHRWGDQVRAPWANDVPGPNSGGKDAAFRITTKTAGAFCACGAWRGELGSEPGVGLFIAHLVLIFDEVRRVLRPDGVLWCNLGDSYAGSGKGPTGKTGIGDQTQRQGFTGEGQKRAAGPAGGTIVTNTRRKGRGIRGGEGYELHDGGSFPGLKPKNLLLVPERFAIAMQEGGWWVRSRIAWTKASPMPESVADRPTSAWEHVWLFTKSAAYFWDKEGSRSADKGKPSGNGFVRPHRISGGLAGGNPDIWQPGVGANLRNVWNLGPEPSRYDYCGSCDTFYLGPERSKIRAVWAPTLDGADFERLRFCPTCFCPDGWVAHFAAFPTELARRCIQAATSEHGACVACGAPWRRRVDRQYANPGNRTTNGPKGDAGRKHQPGGSAEYPVRLEARVATVGWEPSCRCQTTDVEPCVVLDIFWGSGTTSVAARHLGRRSIGIELRPEYAQLGRHRMARDVPKWASPVKAPGKPKRRLKPVPPAQPTLFGEAV